MVRFTTAVSPCSRSCRMMPMLQGEPPNTIHPTQSMSIVLCGLTPLSRSPASEQQRRPLVQYQRRGSTIHMALCACNPTHPQLPIFHSGYSHVPACCASQGIGATAPIPSQRSSHTNLKSRHSCKSCRNKKRLLWHRNRLFNLPSQRLVL
jgi:hypothetical protein